MSKTQPVLYQHSELTDDDLFLFNQGTHYQLYDKFGARPLNRGGKDGTYFSVWAPNAEGVNVIGDFNGWNKTAHALAARGNSGVWEGFIPGVGKGAHYKYFIRSREQGYKVEKSDPFAIYNELAPKSASIVWDLDYAWADADWMATRKAKNSLEAPSPSTSFTWARGARNGRGRRFAELPRNGRRPGRIRPSKWALPTSR